MTACEAVLPRTWQPCRLLGAFKHLQCEPQQVGSNSPQRWAGPPNTCPVDGYSNTPTDQPRLSLMVLIVDIKQPDAKPIGCPVLRLLEREMMLADRP